MSLTLEVKKIGRSFCVVAGVSVLGKFKNEQQANKSIIDDAELYKYYAGSAGVSIQNTPSNVVYI